MEPTHVIELTNILRDIFYWNKSRCQCLAYFVLGVLTVCTVTLSKISTTFSGSIQLSSRQKRLRRFLTWLSDRQGFQLAFGRFVLRSLKIKKMVLSIDRTNWKFGKSHINFLVIGVWYLSVSIPIYWVNLGAAGNSNTATRIDAFKNLLKEVSTTNIKWVLGDREFIGEQWFQYLIEFGIPFGMRIKSDPLVKVYRGKYYRLKKIFDLFHCLKPGKVKEINNCEVYGSRVNLVACLSVDGELVVIASNRRAKKALKEYRKRWGIETLFSCLKGRGFNFEDTHITDPRRGEALLFVLSFALYWSMRLGSESVGQCPLEKASHGRARVSIFRRGLDLLRESLFQICSFLGKVLSYLQLLKIK